MRNEKSRGAAVFGRKIFAVKSERDPRLLVLEILQRQIGGVVTVRMHECISGIGLYLCKDRIEGDAFPGCAEFGPSRNAVKINGYRIGGQFTKRRPVPSLQNVGAVADGKLPPVERDMRRRPRGQDREIGCEVLARWQLYICGLSSTGKAT